jgi:predicted DNA-binding transcriptional regulator YafY
VRRPRREPPGGDPGRFVAESIAAAPQRFEARVTLHLPAAEARERFGSGWGRIEPIDDRTCEYRTGDYDLDWLALRVAMLGAEFEVREPPELVGRLRDLAARVERAVAAAR